MYKLNLIDKISFLLVIIGAINWGLIGVSNFDLVAALFGSISQILQRIIYIAVGIAAIDLLVLLFKSKIFTFKR
ncbi:DUF378 domain-containing protein [Desnuesiella massiliensis]|uniref:DUF378 domain-containing protein n=1 Tax=Desnuesiella massiliensis TaxID=1650662 RepID=UPI0006E162EE|nr:DUF378 domain-containing protein [Desnuesiella massiliensis]